jgi:DNA invertase Pin-like site-specific DNA recombinase
VTEKLSDQGRSAWTGDNLRTGHLGKLLERFEREGAANTVLVVEKLDRLSRQPPLVMAAWVQRACATGLLIATADGAHTIDAQRLVRDQMTVLGMIFESFRGYSESQAKSERVADAWARKRERGAAMTRRCPAWLTIAEGVTSYRSAANADAKYTVVADRAALVLRMFRLTAAGVGKATIAAQLNSEGVPSWGRGHGWHASYVQKIIRNPAVIGEYQPHTKPRGGKREPVGSPILDYFPAVVPTGLFEQVNDRRAALVVAQQSPNPLVNLFAGLAHCTHCGATMTLASKGYDTLADGGKVARRYLKCSSAHRSAGCGARLAWPYAAVEHAVLNHILHLAMDDQHFTGGQDLGQVSDQLASAKRLLAKAERQKEAAFAMLEEDAADDLAQSRYRQRREEVKASRARIAALSEEHSRLAGAVTPEEHVARVSEIRAMIWDDDNAVRYAARARVKLALNELVSGLEFSASKRRFSVTLVDGVRVLSFDLAGRCGLDIDWHDLRPNDARARAPAAREYIRRKTANAPQSARG